MAERNPNLISPKTMEAMASTSGSARELYSEIFTKINNAKDKPKKIEVLKRYDTPNLRMVLKGAFDPKIEWDLPPGIPPYIANEAPAGTEHTYLEIEAKRFYNFVKGGNDAMNRKETMFIQLLEGLHPEEAEIVCLTKDKQLQSKYKITYDMVKEAYPDIQWGNRS